MSRRVSRFIVLALLLSWVCIENVASEPPGATRASLNNYYLEEILRGMTDEVEGQEGRWSFELYDVPMMLITDEPADRLRLIAMISEAKDLKPEELLALLEANFDRALDAKYAVWNGMVWSTYVHPLSDLTENELKSAVRQVANLKRNYGTSFSSTGIIYDAVPVPRR